MTQTATATLETGQAVPQTQANSLNSFLAGVEHAALRTAQIGLGHREDALDAVQDAMLRLARSYGRRPPEEWTPLFWSILRRRITDLQRRRKVRSIMLGWRYAKGEDGDELPAWEPADSGPGPDRVLADKEAMQQLERALRKLPRRQYEAFSLRILNDLDGVTTAAAMRCSEGSVKTHLSRARAALRDYLEDWQ